MAGKYQKNNAEAFPVVGTTVLVFLFFMVLVLGKRLLRDDFSVVFAWWAALFGLGLAFLPFSEYIFGKFKGGGFIFSKMLGLAVAGWFLWFLSSIHILKYTRTNVIVIVVLFAVINYGLWIFLKRENGNGRFDIKINPEKIVYSIYFEVFFLLLFILLCYMKGFNPSAYGTEKMMDYGFMTMLMKTDYMPPEDFWFSGTSINYYYLGQYMATFVTKLAGVGVEYGYNLDLMMIAAIGAAMVYALVLSVVSLKNKNIILGNVAGILSFTAVFFAGNMHYLVFAKFIPMLQNLFNIGEAEKYWFPDATRYIGYNPDVDDKTIHEFPAYSIVLGDLHAHVTNIVFVLMILAVLFAWILHMKDKKGSELSLKEEALHPIILLVGFFIGIFHMTNYWDFPIYFVVSGAVILFSEGVVTGFNKLTLKLIALQAAVVVVVAEIVAFMFTIRFDSMAGGIGICTRHSAFYQLVILWGFPVCILICFMVRLIEKYIVGKAEKEKGSLAGFLSSLDFADMYMMVLGLCAFGLVLIPEVIYVRDIYEGAYSRANTMFKLTYQAFIMFGIMMGYVLTMYFAKGEKIKTKIFAGIAVILLLASVGYWNIAVESWFTDITVKENRKNLDASKYIYTEQPEDALAIGWINENTEGRPVILEANGDSYTIYGRVSTLTGCPTLLGWYVHEWLWKDRTDILAERVQDINSIYCGDDKTVVYELLKKYNISYIYVGELENDKFEAMDTSFIKSLGEVVYQSDTDINTFLVKVVYE